MCGAGGGFAVLLSHLHHFPLNASPASRLRSAATVKAEKCPHAPGGDTRLKPERLRPPLGLQLPVLPVTLPALQGAAGTSGAAGACTTPKRSCSSAAAPKAAAAGTFWGLGGRGAPEAPLGRAKEAQLHTSSLFVCFTDESFLKRCASPCLPTCLRVTHCQLRAARRDPQVPPAVTPSPERDRGHTGTRVGLIERTKAAAPGQDLAGGRVQGIWLGAARGAALGHGQRCVAMGSVGPGQPVGHGARESSAEAVPEGRAGVAVPVIAKVILASGAWERAAEPSAKGAAAPPRSDSGRPPRATAQHPARTAPLTTAVGWPRSPSRPLPAPRPFLIPPGSWAQKRRAPVRPHLLRPLVLVTGASSTSPSPLCSHQRPLPARAQVTHTSCGTLWHPGPKPEPVEHPWHGAVCPCCTGEPRAALSTAARGRHAGWAGAAQLAPPETPRETCPSLKLVLRRESGRARCHPERPELPPPAHPAWHCRSYQAPGAAGDPAGGCSSQG